MAKRKSQRNYEEVTNGIQKKKSVSQQTEVKSGLGSRDSELIQCPSSSDDHRIGLAHGVTVGGVHQPDVSSDSGTCESSSGGTTDLGGRDIGSLGDNPSSGCDAESERLRSHLSTGEDVDLLAADSDTGGHVPLRSGLAFGLESHEEDEQSRAASYSGEEFSRIEYPTGVADRVSFTDTGMNTDDCIHAMKLLARFMDMCNAFSDYPNADIPEIKECYNAWEQEYAAIATIYYKALDDLEESGG